MLYIPVTSEANAEAISRRLYKLSRPDNIVDPNDVTQYIGPWHIHPTTNQVRLGIPEDLALYIHPDADETILDDLLIPFIGIAITAAELDAIHISLSNAKGANTVIWNDFPLYWKAYAKTHQQLQTEGWFPDPETP